MNNIITYEQAQEICKYYNNFNFSEHFFKIENYKISTFNYFICNYNNFANPIPNKNINAFDLRGITFVFNEDGTLWNRFLMLPKFFNLNETEFTQYNNVKNKKIINISTKEDGSLIAFMLLPNQKIFAKTIAGFSNEQCIASLKLLYEHDEHVLWVKDMLNKGYTPLFEYISWDNRIVLKYSKSEIRLIGIRNNNTGEFCPASLISIIPENMNYIKSYNFTLEELIEKSKIEENKEGWVIQFEDGQLLKLKTEWYFRLHNLRTENIFRPDYVIKNYLENKIDDIISQLDPSEDKDAFEFVKIVKNAVNNFLIYIDKSIYEFKNDYDIKYNKDWNKFATDNYKKAFFNLANIFIKYPEKYNESKKEFIIKMNYKLNNAKNFIEKWA